MKTLILSLFIFASTAGMALAAPKDKKGAGGATASKKMIYEYKTYERIDLGGLEVHGNIIAPGDISVKERERKEFSRDLLDRRHFDPETKEDVYNLR